MNSTNNQNTTGSATTLAEHVANELRKSGTKAWAGFPSPEEMEQLRAEKAELEFQSTKRRIENHDQKMANLTERAKRILRGDVADE